MSQSCLPVTPPERTDVSLDQRRNSFVRTATAPRTVWIDLENSPHVPFFRPIIEQIESSGHSVLLTARDCFQVCGLADMFSMRYKRIGRHYGKHMVAKAAGLGIRVAQMLPTVLHARPDLAISHGSRSMFVLASLLRIPTLTIFDYEHSRWVKVLRPTWVMAPEVIPEQSVCKLGIEKDRILRYPGIKEDVYVPFFEPDPAIKARLGIDSNDLVVTLRPPATEAHYHNPESEDLLKETLEYAASQPNVKLIILPRTHHQGEELRQAWPEMFNSRKFTIPDQVVDGLDLIWYSDLVISGGGTMNREAAALGVPVYSIFRGKIGAVDRYLSQTGRLCLLEKPDDIRRKLRFVRRQKRSQRTSSKQNTLNTVVGQILTILESPCPRQN